MEEEVKNKIEHIRINTMLAIQQIAVAILEKEKHGQLSPQTVELLEDIEKEKV